MPMPKRHDRSFPVFWVTDSQYPAHGQPSGKPCILAIVYLLGAADASLLEKCYWPCNKRTAPNCRCFETNILSIPSWYIDLLHRIYPVALSHELYRYCREKAVYLVYVLSRF